ncbi:DUF2268 domain-containing protein [Sutcliffiella cohnii]|uniref:DUF2268 domain-containing protein n=1 Tax=Sutcliffiella cohnii TaxID=33932 RepID=UPI002E1B3A7A|nr:DUF2268 domain-containing putative Zn-dependent protease [Sutcliffiella cohnii]MED4018749.1 DUF2268 domain-containing putative Zn-dependent protease [Sutcliffiella cohnii]
MKIVKYVMIFMFVLLLSACEETVDTEIKEEVEVSEGVFTVAHETFQQTFEIIPLYENFHEYIEKSEIEDANLRFLYLETVFLPSWDKCFKDGEYLDLMNNYIQNPPTNIHDTKRIVNEMMNTNLEEVVQAALKKSSEILPGPDTTVCILPYNQNAGGVALNVGAGKIVIFYNKQFYNTEDNLAGTVAHEYHHSVWTDEHYSGEPMTLLDYLIFEGRAESFKRILYPEASIFTVSPQQEEANWNKIERELDSTNYEYNQQVIFGGGGFPRLYGYAIGFNIMQDFLEKNPDATIEEWTALSPEEILEKSNYVDRFR